jgi:hypothetical protein
VSDQIRQVSGGLGRWSAAGLVVAAPFLAWAAVGRHDTGGDYAAGPYDVGLPLEIAVGALAVVVFIASLVISWRDRRRVDWHPDVSAGTVVLGVAATSAIAVGWRVMTAGVIGANIGAGLIAIIAPVTVAGCLVGAVACQHAFRPLSRPVLVCLYVVAAGAAPALFLAAAAVAG